MRRRHFIGGCGASALWPCVAQAQTPKLPVIGFLRAGDPPKTFVDAFEDGLRSHGYVAGQNALIEFRFGNTEDLPQLAEELVRLNVDVILASASSAALAAKNATKSIPIVMAAVYSPVEIDLVSSLAHPGANITGTAITAGNIASKRLQLLRELVPMIKHVVMLSHLNHASSALQLEAVEIAARSLGVQLDVVELRSADEFGSALQSLRDIGGLLHGDTPLFNSNRSRFLEAIAKTRLPAIHPYRGYADDGGLISYGPNVPELFRQSGVYVAKLLKGARPADLPVEQPTRFDLVLNMKTALACNITVPLSIIARADEVVE